jgi:hypothetical protein
MKAVDPEQIAAFRQRIAQRLAGLGARYGVESAEIFKRISDL